MCDNKKNINTDVRIFYYLKIRRFTQLENLYNEVMMSRRVSAIFFNNQISYDIFLMKCFLCVESTEPNRISLYLLRKIQSMLPLEVSGCFSVLVP